MNSEEIKEILTKNLKNISGIFHEYRDRILIDDKISDVDTLLISMFIIEEKQGKTGVKYEDCKSVFLYLGRKYFKQAVYEAKNRKYIEKINNTLNFLVKGIKRLKEILGMGYRTSVYVIKSNDSGFWTRNSNSG